MIMLEEDYDGKQLFSLEELSSDFHLQEIATDASSHQSVNEDDDR